MRCINCGCENSDNVEYCEICGSELSNIRNVQESMDEEEMDKKHPVDKDKIIVIALATAIALVAALTAGFLIKINKDKNEYIPHSDNYPIFSESDSSYTSNSSDKEETETQKISFSETTNKESTAKNESTTKKLPETTVKSENKKISISEWVLEEDVPPGSKVVQEKWTYNKTVKKVTNDHSPEKDGYTLYDTDWKWSSYGSWSNWSTTVYSNSDSREADARTTYRFHAFVCSKCGSRDPYSTPCDNCGTTSTMIWEETYFPFKGTSKSYTDIGGKPRISYEGKYWYFEYNGQTDGQGGTGQPSRTEYRYRDRSKVYTYYYQKTESKESNSKVTESDTISNVEHWIKYAIS